MGNLSYTDQQKMKESVKINHNVELGYFEKNGDAANFRKQVEKYQKSMNTAMFWGGIK